jgi:predicted dehydrogenase
MSEQPVGIGLVGAGAYGQFCLEAFAQMPEVRIVAVADVDAERARTLGERYGAKGYDSIGGLLDHPDVEIVALNTPPNFHAEQGVASLKAGKHLFCEKPLALTIEEGERLIDAAKENQMRLTVDYVMRRNPYWGAAAALAQSGVLGALRHMDLANHAAGLELPSHHWFWDKAKSGGIWIEHGVHFFDAFAWIAGEGGQVLASKAYYRPDGVNNRVEALAQYGTVAAHFYHAFDKSSRTEQTTVRLTFENGYVTLSEWVPTSIELLTPVSFAELQPFLKGSLEHQTAEGKTWARAYAPEGKSTLYRQCIQAGMRDLAAAVRKADHPLTVTGEHGLDSLRMAVAAESLA